MNFWYRISNAVRSKELCPRGAASTLMLIVFTLLACRKSDVKGSLDFDGAEFEVEECRVGQLVVGQTSNEPAHRFVLLDDGDGRELHVSDEKQAKISVFYVAAPGQKPVLIGSDCGALKMEGDPVQSPASVRGSLEVSCAAGGHKLTGKIEYSRCKAWNMLKPSSR